MNKKSLVIFAVGLLVGGLVIFGVTNDDGDNDSVDLQAEVSEDQVSAAFENEENGDPVGDAERQELYPWKDQTNPVLMGVEINRFTDTNEETLNITRRIAEINNSVEGEDDFTDEQIKELEDLGKQLSAIEYSAYLPDEKAEFYLLPEQLGPYLEFRNEYFDEEGNEIKEIDPNNL